MERARLCAVAFCKQPAASSLAYQEFCVTHFIAHCYGKLDQCSMSRQRGPDDSKEATSLQEFLEECSRQAVDICLSQRDLDNIQRSRLLDILLWAGDLASESNVPQGTNLQ